MNATRCIGEQNKNYINNNDDNLFLSRHIGSNDFSQQLPLESTPSSGKELSTLNFYSL